MVYATQRASSTAVWKCRERRIAGNYASNQGDIAVLYGAFLV
jgi:hypothetical protein